MERSLFCFQAHAIRWLCFMLATSLLVCQLHLASPIWLHFSETAGELGEFGGGALAAA